jgi:hypothetical protein
MCNSKRGVSLNDSLQRIFTAACLLTGSPQAAETAILEGIQASSPYCREGLLEASLAAALSIQCDGRGDKLNFPVELRRVLELPRRIRAAFVLRVLLRLPLETCRRLIDVRTEELDEMIRLSARILARPIEQAA